MASSFATELRVARRSLRSSPAFTLAVTVSLALGIGAAGTAFAAFEALVVRPVGYPDARRIVSISESAKGDDQDGVLTPDAELWQRSSRSLAALATYKPTRFTLTGAGDADEVDGAIVSSEFLRVLSLDPNRGRDFTKSDEGEGAEPVVMVGDRLWTERFGRDPRLVGRAIVLDGKPYRVIAIAPPSLALPAGAQLWSVRTRAPGGGAIAFVSAVGRLESGATVEQVRSELAGSLRVQDGTRPAWFPKNWKGLDVVAMPLADRLFGAARAVLLMLMLAVGALFVIACINIANLLFGRMLARRSDLVIRLALGARVSDLFRASLAEACVLALIGGVAGTGLAGVGVFAFGRAAQASVAAAQQLRFDAGLALVSLVLAVGVGLMLTAVSTFEAQRTSRVRGLLTDVTHTTASRGHQHLRRLFVFVQVAGTLPLVVAAVVMAKSLANVLAVDVGFRHDNVLAVDVGLSPRRYASAQPTQVFFDGLAKRVQAFPGVESVAYAGDIPLRGIVSLTQVAPEEDSKRDALVAVTNVSQGFAEAAGLELVSGRQFGSGDVQGSEPVVMLSVAAARALFPNGDAIGHRVRANFSGSVALSTVVGVVRDVPQLGLDVAPKPQVYLPISQFGGWPTILIVRTSVDPQLLGGPIRQAVAELDPLQAVRAMSTMDAELAASVAPRRRDVAIVETFSVVALLLSAIGLYGLVAYQVRVRAKEFGLRMALGAPATQVLMLVVNEAATTIAPAMFVGFMAALSASRVLQNFVFGVTGRDLRSLILAAVILVFAAVVACLPGALRAIRVNPVITLRNG